MPASLVSAGDTRSSLWLPKEVFVNVFVFLGLQDLASSVRVCEVWNSHIDDEDHWRIRCQNLFGLSGDTDVRSCVSESSSCKAIFRLVDDNIVGASVYERYIGGVGSVPRIPEGISLKRWDKPDPCDLTKKIGREYVWMYIPSHIVIDSEGIALSKTDDPNDVEAPQLLRRKVGFWERIFRAIGFGTRSTSTLKVPVTINNIKTLFEHPKAGNPSTYRFVRNEILEQHGNKRSTAGWVYMRKEVIGKSLPFAEQQALAGATGVVLSELLPRILFNCLGHLRSGKASIYPDGQDPLTYARTSTIIKAGARGTARPLGCGFGSPSGLGIYANTFGSDNAGVAVVLPAEVQAIDP